MWRSHLTLPTDILAVPPVVVAQFTLGKKAAFPLGLVMGLSVWSIALIIILCDLFLMAVVDWLYTHSVDRFPWTQSILARSRRIQDRLMEGGWSQRLLKLGWMAPLVITSTPFAGGVWTGMAMARLLHLSHTKTLFSVGLGVIVGCGIFALAALGLTSWVTFSEV